MPVSPEGCDEVQDSEASKSYRSSTFRSQITSNSILASTDTFQQENGDGVSATNEIACNHTDTANNSRLRTALEWVIKFMNITADKSVELSRLIIMYRAFEDNNMAYFEDIETSEEGGRLLKELKSQVDKLVLEQKDLEAMAQKCSVRARMVSEIQSH